MSEEADWSDLLCQSCLGNKGYNKWRVKSKFELSCVIFQFIKRDSSTMSITEQGGTISRFAAKPPPTIYIIRQHSLHGILLLWISCNGKVKQKKPGRELFRQRNKQYINISLNCCLTLNIFELFWGLSLINSCGRLDWTWNKPTFTFPCTIAYISSWSKS